jgi:glucuronate isomerase
MTTQSGKAEQLYQAVSDLPIISPHGHTDPRWFAENQAFADPAELLIIPDHYVFRMLYSQGVSLADLGVGVSAEQRNPRAIFQIFAQHWHLFLGTPSRQWLEHTFENVFGITLKISAHTADAIFDQIDAALKTPEFRPRALLERLNIELIATTDTALDSLAPHARFAESGNLSKVVPTFRPDALIDPAIAGFKESVDALGAMTGENTSTYAAYLAALANRRAVFKAAGATAADHAINTLDTEWLDASVAQGLLDKALQGTISTNEAHRFANHMLIEMARMSVDDGLVMQIHAGSQRNTNKPVFEAVGSDMGADIPKPTNWVSGLNALLDQVGNDTRMGLIAFTLDESTYSRELAPMAGHWPAMKLGPPWWFHDSPAGIARYFDLVVETAGYFNLAGFNDDTRALLSVPARHDMWRQAVSRHLADQVEAGRFDMSDATDLAKWLAYDAAKSAYRLGSA